MTSLRSICVLRLSAIGDVSHALAVVHQLREQRPDAAITWVIGRLEHKLLKGLEGVEFVEFDKSQGFSAFRKLKSQLRGRRFDALLHMQVAARANLVSLCVKADQRVGFDAARSRDGHGLFINRRIAAAPGQHVLDGLLSFLVPLGLIPGRPGWKLPLDDSDQAFADEHLDPNRPTLLISPCSSHTLRNWPADRYAAVADHAIRRYGFQVILAGGPGTFERQFGADIESAMHQKADNLIGKDTLKQAAATLGAADLVIAPDTGPAHIANAMGTPVVGLYAASNPRRSGPYHSLDWTVDRYDQACRKFHGKGADEVRWGAKVEVPGAMELITVEDVVERVDRFVETRL